MCHWCRKLEPILARESYPLPIRPLTPHLHALHGAASHRLGIWYRNRLLIMTDLLRLVRPLEKWRLDVGLAGEVRKEIVYLKEGLEEHPVERDEPRGWRVGRERERGSEGAASSGASQVGSGRSTSAAASGGGGGGGDLDAGHEDGEASVRAGEAGEDAGEEEGSIHAGLDDGAGGDGSYRGGDDDAASERGVAGVAAGQPEMVDEPPAHGAPRGAPPPPDSKKAKPARALPRFGIRNPWRAYIEELVAAKVAEQLARERMRDAAAAAEAAEAGAGDHEGNEEEEEEKGGGGGGGGGNADPPAAAAREARAAGGAIRGEENQPHSVREPAARRQKGKSGGGMFARLRAKTALEPPMSRASVRDGRNKTARRARGRGGHFMHGGLAVETPPRGRGGVSERGSAWFAGVSDLYDGASVAAAGDGDAAVVEDEHGQVDGDGDADTDADGGGAERSCSRS
ncbi:hypothetical protein MMC08_003708 [Hypocenomyce scalaris]|nr:hypothetical protein [Hypocenomyce scalaris]